MEVQEPSEANYLQDSLSGFIYLLPSELVSDGIYRILQIEKIEAPNTDQPSPFEGEFQLVQIIPCDVEITVEDTILYANRGILESHSELFKQAFINSEPMAIWSLWLVGCFDPEEVRSLIDYLHGGNMPTTEQGLTLLLKASSYFKMHSIVDACLQILWKTINPYNALVFRECAETAESVEWMEKIGQYIRQNFEHVCLTEEFLRQNFHALKKLVCWYHLRVEREDKLLNSIFRWIRACEGDRRAHLPELLRLIRIPLLLDSYVSKILGNDFIRDSSVCKKIINEARKRLFLRLLLPVCGRTVMHAVDLQDTDSVLNNFYTLYQRENNSVAVYYYRSRARSWDTLVKRKLKILPNYLVCSEKTLYFIGNSSTCAMDVSSWQITPLPINGETPYGAGIVFHGSKIYFFGNISPYQAYEVLEFVPQDGSYHHVGNMLESRVDARVVSMETDIYVTGGYFADNVLSSSEKYDPETKKCAPISPMLRARYGHGCAALGGRIYVCGGYTLAERQVLSTNTAEVYDPSTDQWTSIAEMNNAKFFRGYLFAIANELVAVERDCDRNTQYQISIYDPSAQEWRYGGYLANYGIDLTIVKTNFASSLWR